MRSCEISNKDKKERENSELDRGKFVFANRCKSGSGDNVTNLVCSQTLDRGQHLAVIIPSNLGD